MRALRPMTQEERDFAEQHHDLVIDYLCRKRLPTDDFYDVVIFGYLSAVQQYFRNPPAGVAFKAMAFRAMKDSVLREGEYLEAAYVFITSRGHLVFPSFSGHFPASSCKKPVLDLPGLASPS